LVHKENEIKRGIKLKQREKHMRRSLKIKDKNWELVIRIESIVGKRVINFA